MNINSVKDFRAFLLEELKKEREEFKVSMQEAIDSLDYDLKFDCINFCVEVFASVEAANLANRINFSFRISQTEMMRDLIENATRLEGILIPAKSIQKACDENGEEDFKLPLHIMVSEPLVESGATVH